MLKKTRIVLAVIMLAGITLLFVFPGADYACGESRIADSGLAVSNGTVPHECIGWMAKVQFLPATLRVIADASFLNIAVVAAILLLTFLFGRLYCSVICPLGIFQDCIIWLRRMLGKLINQINIKVFKHQQAHHVNGEHIKPKKPIVKWFKYHKAYNAVRYTVLALTVLALVSGLQVFVALIAPYSSYGRIVRSAVGIASGEWSSTLTVAGALMFAVIALCSWFWGREWCNTVCPVGTLLGLVSIKPVFGIRFDKAKCTNCGRCVRGCKSSCIDIDRHSVDHSRCIDCFDCIKRCKEDAVHFGLLGNGKAGTAENQGMSRRAFIGTTLIALGGAATAKASELTAVSDGEQSKKQKGRSVRIVPAGAKSLKNFYGKCTACQLCVTACPNGVLRPSSDLEHLLQPEMSFEKGYCRPECSECSNVCPSGAILPVTPDERREIRTGTARVELGLCIAASEGEKCGNCARHCPVGAIRMIKDGKTGARIPSVIEERCIGCGACEHLCPVNPVSAITVEGLEKHIVK